MTSTRGKNLRIPLHLSRSALWKNEKTKDEAGREDKTRAMRNTDNKTWAVKEKAHGTRHQKSTAVDFWKEGQEECAR